VRRSKRNGLESFLRWDSRVKYYPTLVCICLEEEELFQRRLEQNGMAIQQKSQIKLRVKGYDVGTITDEQVSVLAAPLRGRFKSLRELWFETGSNRLTYVRQGEVRWKTTVFANNRREAERVLTRLCAVVDETFSKSNLSVTMGRALSGSNQTDLVTLSTLYKAVLLINKKDAPITLFHANDSANR
jgi:hypothetical protein